jgi:hypothetical protein
VKWRVILEFTARLLRRCVNTLCRPGYRRKSEPVSPKLAPFTGIIDAIVEADKQVHVKQRCSAVSIGIENFPAIGMDNSRLNREVSPVAQIEDFVYLLSKVYKNTCAFLNE